MRQLNKYDCLRANKSTMAWSVEARTPFLDRRFLEKAFSFDPKHKMCVDEETGQPRMEKYLLRKAFDDEENPYLPRSAIHLSQSPSVCLVGQLSDWDITLCKIP